MRRFGLGALAMLLLLGLAGTLVAALAPSGTGLDIPDARVVARSVTLSAGVAGLVQEVAPDGRPLAAGAPVLRLDDAPLRVAVQGSEAQLDIVRQQIATLEATYQQAQALVAGAHIDADYAATVLDRQRNLAKVSAGSRANLETAEHDMIAARERIVITETQAAGVLTQLGGAAAAPVETRASYRQAAATLARTRRELARAVVATPFSGVPARLPGIDTGAYVTLGQPLARLSSTTDLWVEARLPAREAAGVEPGQAASVVPPGSAPRRATVDGLGPAPDGSPVMVVRLRLAAGSPVLREGVGVEVRIDTGRERPGSRWRERLVTAFAGLLGVEP